MESKKKINIHEAPRGFYACLKSDVNALKVGNICRACDARMLCQENKNDWCLNNRCMAYEVRAFKDGKIYKRKDGCSVIFKKYEK